MCSLRRKNLAHPDAAAAAVVAYVPEEGWRCSAASADMQHFSHFSSLADNVQDRFRPRCIGDTDESTHANNKCLTVLYTVYRQLQPNPLHLQVAVIGQVMMMNHINSVKVTVLPITKTTNTARTCHAPAPVNTTATAAAGVYRLAGQK